MPERKVRFTPPAMRIRGGDTKAASEVFVLASPRTFDAGERDQFDSMIADARLALSSVDVRPQDIAWGVMYLAAAPRWSVIEALAKGLGLPHPDSLPITTLVQPPLPVGCFCALHLKLLRGQPVWHGVTSKPRSSTVLRGKSRHVHLLSITPRPDLGRTATFADVAYDMFARAGHELTARGMRFADVVRTWIYLRDIRSHYEEFNRARNHYFEEQGVSRLPASTGIGGALAGTDFPLAMDLYAVASSDPATVSTLSCEPMGEASDYGAAFARGMVVAEGGRRVVYLSGTASIDKRGKVLAVGDPMGQVEYMLANIEGLLAHEKMGWEHSLSGTLYLDDATILAPFLRAAARHGLPENLPLAMVQARICRPEWLCEMELVAAKSAK